MCTSQDHHFQRRDSDAREKEELGVQVKVKVSSSSQASERGNRVIFFSIGAGAVSGRSSLYGSMK